MLILALKTNEPDAKLVLLQDETVIARHTWYAHRALSDTLHRTVEALLRGAAIEESDVQGLIVHKGPGSFTGIRIGIAYMQALALVHSLPIVGVNGDEWVTRGVHKLQQGDYTDTITPDYGSEARTTSPKK